MHLSERAEGHEHSQVNVYENRLTICIERVLAFTSADE